MALDCISRTVYEIIIQILQNYVLVLHEKY